MPESAKQRAARVRESLNIRREIISKFGDEMIKKVEQRLCKKCADSPCGLLPLCLDGRDCPFFKEAKQGSS